MSTHPWRVFPPTPNCQLELFYIHLHLEIWHPPLCLVPIASTSSHTNIGRNSVRTKAHSARPNSLQLMGILPIDVRPDSPIYVKRTSRSEQHHRKDNRLQKARFH